MTNRFPVPVSSFGLVALLVASFSPIRAQEGMSPPTPAPELKKLEPLIGNWRGKGSVDDPTAGKSGWTAVASYKWALGGFWVQEDLTITFETLPNQLTFRSFLGWDPERHGYVAAKVSNSGAVGIDEIEILPDGTLLTMAKRWEDSVFVERSRVKVDGDRMSVKIVIFGTSGESTAFVEGRYERVEAEAPDALAAGPFVGSAAPEMARLARSAGRYETRGELVMMPGMPSMKIKGEDTFTELFEGRALHGHTVGMAEGAPDTYVAEVFWGWDSHRGHYVSAYVDNMGMVGEMDMYVGPDGKTLTSIMKGTMGGQPMVQRFVMQTDEKGAFVSGIGHTIVGTAPPFESFKATYRKK